jgi:hypothetical protein
VLPGLCSVRIFYIKKQAVGYAAVLWVLHLAKRSRPLGPADIRPGIRHIARAGERLYVRDSRAWVRVGATSRGDWALPALVLAHSPRGGTQPSPCVRRVAVCFEYTVCTECVATRVRAL